MTLLLYKMYTSMPMRSAGSLTRLGVQVYPKLGVRALHLRFVVVLGRVRLQERARGQVEEVLLPARWVVVGQDADLAGGLAGLSAHAPTAVGGEVVPRESFPARLLPSKAGQATSLPGGRKQHV